MNDPAMNDVDDLGEPTEPELDSELEDEHPDDPVESDADDTPYGDTTEATTTSNGIEGVQDSPIAGAASRYLPLREIVLEYKFWENPRTHSGLDAGDLASLAESIKARTITNEDGLVAGLRSPMEVVMIKGANGAVVNLAIDGQRRHRATTIALGTAADDALIPVTDLEPEPVEWTRELALHYLLEVLEIPGTRAGLSSYELAKSVAKLRGQKDLDTGKEYTLAKLATKIGRSESWVSKILKAMDCATPKLLNSWGRGDITDEQFKFLASQKDPEEQAKATNQVVDARKSGDKATSRVLAAEQKEQAKIARAKEKEKAAKPTKTAKGTPAPKGKGKEKLAVRGPQLDLLKSKGDAPPAAPVRKPPSFAVVEDFVGTAAKRPPTHEYVKGLMDGARWAVGLMDSANFAKPWQSYIALVAGQPAAAKSKAKKPAKKH